MYSCQAKELCIEKRLPQNVIHRRKCSHLLCLSLTEIMMGPLVTFDSPGLYPVFEMQMLKCKKRMFGY